MRNRGRAAWGALAFVLLLAALFHVTCGQAPAADPAAPATDAQPPDAPPNRNRFAPDLAANEEVEQFIRSFEGRGAIGDDSLPTPATEAVQQFQLAPGLQIELVASEPDVAQPLFLHFDARGRMWVVQYLQYPFPAGLKVVRYDQHLRAVFDKVPLPPPHHTPGADKITVFEDRDGDGRYDSHKDVVTGLNIATAVATASDGFWVLNPPYLLFYPDADGDDVPDGDPEVHLSGFGLEDTHSVASSLAWGPDGWLYGANGSTTTASISSAASHNVAFKGQCIWRYHPRTHVFEIYAEGGGNTFSLSFDAVGRAFSGTNYGGVRGMYYPQGAYGIKGWAKHGPLTNPYAFGWIEHMRHQGSDQDRFPQAMCLYAADGLPPEYQGTLIAANALHNRVWASTLQADGSTFQTADLPPLVTTPDKWFRPVDVKTGPDGAVYFADWYDTRLSHVDPRDNWHKGSGRIYRLSAQTPVGALRNPLTDLTRLTTEELLGALVQPNSVLRGHAVRLLAARTDAALIPRLRDWALSDRPGALEALWTLHLAGDFDSDLAVKLLGHSQPDVRRWTVRLLGDKRRVDAAAGAELVHLAEREPYVQVRAQIASSAKRLEAALAVPVLRALLARSEDQSDPHQPLLLWWGLEGHCGASRDDVLSMFDDPDVWRLPIVEQAILERLMQRFALEAVTAPQDAAGLKTAKAAFAACTRLFARSPGPEHSRKLLAGFQEAYAGREIRDLPSDLLALVQQAPGAGGEQTLILALKLGEADAVSRAVQFISGDGHSRSERLAVIAALGEQHPPEAQGPLLNLLGAPAIALKRAALQALMAYDDPQVGSEICSRWHTTLPDEQDLRGVALRVLASRAPWARALLKEIEESRIRPEVVPADVVQQMRLHGDSELDQQLDQVFGRTRATPAEKQAQLDRLLRLLRGGDAPSPSGTPATGAPGEATLADEQAERGRALFVQHCGVCHTLFGAGGQTGPNLTGYDRDKLDFMLLAIVDPSAGIREEYTQFAIATTDGRVLNGLIDQQTETTVLLRGANNQTTLLDRDEIDTLQALRTSLMPDGLLEKLDDGQLRDLFAYLQRRTPPPGAAGAAAQDSAADNAPADNAAAVDAAQGAPGARDAPPDSLPRATNEDG